MGKVVGRTPAGLLLFPPDLFKDNLFIQCPHISINISKQMRKAATRLTIATPRHPDTRIRSQRISGWIRENMDAQNDGVGRYQSWQKVIVEIFY